MLGGLSYMKCGSIELNTGMNLWYTVIRAISCFLVYTFNLSSSEALQERLGYGLTDLRLYTSTKLKIVNYWFYSLKLKKQNLYLNNI